MKIVGIVLLILSILTLIAGFWEKNPVKRKENKSAIVFSSILLVVSLLMVMVGGKSKSNTKTITVNQNKASTTKPTDTPVPKLSWENGGVNEATVKAALQDVQGTLIFNILGDLKKVDTTDFAGGKEIDLYYKETDFLDGDELVRKTANTMISCSQKLFKNQKVQLIKFNTLADFTDQYGNSKEDTAFSLSLTRDTASKIDYSNFIEMVDEDYTKLFNIVDDYNIHLGIYKDLKNTNGIPASK